LTAQDLQPYINTRDDSPFRFLGLPTVVRSTGQTTNGAFGLVEQWAIPPGFASPYHTHRLEDEAFYVLEGEMAFVCDGKWVTAGPGTYVFGPRNIPHGCDRCGDRLREVIALSEGLRTLARSGSLRVVVSDQFVQRAVEAGLRVREYGPPLGGSVPCTVAADDDLLVARLAADLSGAMRVDLSFCDAHSVERQRMTDIPIRGDAGTVIYQESITFAKASPSNTMIARLVAVDAEGAERLLGEYTFHHTRTIPGPGGWESS